MGREVEIEQLRVENGLLRFGQYLGMKAQVGQVLSEEEALAYHAICRYVRAKAMFMERQVGNDGTDEASGGGP